MTLGNMIYDSMMGNLIDPIEGVENAFSPGSKCEVLYQRIYFANQRLCQRLRVDEDADAEEIIDCFLTLSRELCLMMY